AVDDPLLVRGIKRVGDLPGDVERLRLGREVAIKILPRAFTADTDRLARFEREARVLASLNHPHIAAIHGTEESAGIRALVLELVEGDTLAQRIAARKTGFPLKGCSSPGGRTRSYRWHRWPRRMQAMRFSQKSSSSTVRRNRSDCTGR